MYIKKLLVGLALSFVSAFVVEATEQEKPNVVLIMCDDLGWGDTGFNGSEIAKTPNLDIMARDGAILNHFYSIGPVCAPTRASFVSGRHYYRLGMFYVNKGHVAKEEYTIAKMMKENGYTTGHFGKWHIGSLSKTHSSKGAVRKPEINFAPPWERDYDESFVTETSCVTYDVGKNSGYKNNPYYYNGEVVKPTDNLDGDDSRIIMDRVIPFIEKAVENKTPFLSVIWFHAPHAPLLAGQKYLDMYPNQEGRAAHYYGVITAMDEQVGRLREKLKELGQVDNTLIFFCSDNGPEGKTEETGTTGGFTGRKRSIYDGGVRVPAFAFFPSRIKAGTFCDVPMSVLDYLPTVAEVTGAKINSTNILDGEDVLPIIEGKRDTHLKSIPFRADSDEGSFACLVKGKFKLIIQSPSDTKKDKLLDLSKDREEKNNVIAQYPELAAEMRAEILTFLESVKNSYEGGEFDTDYKPVTEWQELGNKVSKDMLWHPTSKKKNKKKK